MSPINVDKNMSHHQIDSFNQEFNIAKHHQVSSMDEKDKKLNEQSFVNQLEQLNQSSVHHNKINTGLKLIESTINSGHNTG